MTIRERIFWATIVVALVGVKTVEMIQSFDFTINPIETTIKIIVMIVLATELIRTRLLPTEAKAC